MYRHTEGQHNSSEDFDFPTGIKLDENNRWVILGGSRKIKTGNIVEKEE